MKTFTSSCSREGSWLNLVYVRKTAAFVRLKLQGKLQVARCLRCSSTECKQTPSFAHNVAVLWIFHSNHAESDTNKDSRSLRNSFKTFTCSTLRVFQFSFTNNTSFVVYSTCMLSLSTWKTSSRRCRRCQNLENLQREALQQNANVNGERMNTSRERASESDGKKSKEVPVTRKERDLVTVNESHLSQSRKGGDLRTIVYTSFTTLSAACVRNVYGGNKVKISFTRQSSPSCAY